MQLKRLLQTAATGTYPEALHDSQEVTASQLLRELEDPATNEDVAADPALDAAAAHCASHITPLPGTTRARKVSTGLSSSSKKQRREFKSLFDEQHLGLGQQGANLNDGIIQQGQDGADDVDLVTPPWLQQTTPPASAAPTYENYSITRAAAVAGADILSGVRDSGCDAKNAKAAAAIEALGQDSGWRLSNGAGGNPAAQQQHVKQHSVRTPGSAPGSGHKQQQRQHERMTYPILQQQELQKQLHQAPLGSRPRVAGVMQRQGQQQAPHDVIEDGEEEAICDDSDDEGEGVDPVPGAAAAADLQHLLRRGVQHPTALLTSPRSDGKVLRQRQQGQQGRSSTPTATQGAAAGQSPSLNIGGGGLQWAEGEQHWQQQDASFAASRQLPEQPRMESGLATAAAGSSILGSRAPLQDDDDAAMWEPPKNRRQQQQQQPQIPVSVSRPPAASRMQQASMSAYAAAATDAGFVGGYSAGAEAADSLDVGAAAVDGRAAGGVSSAVEAPPWWTILEDFVPVEVLVQSLVNPRDNSIVHINYKSQFKDGGAAGKRASAAGTATNSSRKKATGSTRARKGAAAKKAAAGTAFTTAGANFLASLQGGRKGSRKGSGGGRKGSRKSGSGRSRGSGSGRGSGGQKKQGRKRTGRWTFINGHKVFIDHSGKQLTGSAAYMQWKATKG